jgi:hypothetical protein
MLNPDFTENGETMQFGFITENGTSGFAPIASVSLVDNWLVVASTVTSVPGHNLDMYGIRLLQNTPNPFNPKTMIRYDLPRPSQVGLHIYDVSGHLVRVLRDAVHKDAGSHGVVWHGMDDSGRRAPSGTYFYRLTAGGYSETRRMVLVK